MLPVFVLLLICTVVICTVMVLEDAARRRGVDLSAEDAS